jgi:FkbM family methyltransferase
VLDLSKYKRFIIEVGANNGGHTGGFADQPEAIVFAFEPSPPLVSELQERFRDRENVIIIPLAVDMMNSFSEFNVSLAGDRGCGSLYPYSQQLKEHALGKDAVFAEGFAFKQRVMSIRLDAFVMLWGIPRVDYIHIDAQGNDFNVVKSFGGRLDMVQEGVCECTYKLPLYEGALVNNFYKDCMAYLEMNGFEVTLGGVHANETECDIHFKRKIING